MSAIAVPSVDALALAVGRLIDAPPDQPRSLWDALSAANGQHAQGTGHPTAKSRPPGTLAVVGLVIDISNAAKEGAQDLAGRTYANAPSNLYAIVDALHIRPDDDLISWWIDAANEWVARAQSILGQSNHLIVSLHGARCPYCQATTVSTHTNGENWITPAIHVEWDTTPMISDYQVSTVVCRACNAKWARGPELDVLVSDLLARNYAHEIDALTD